MPRFLPFAGRNAIAEMILGIQFSFPFGSKIGESSEAIKSAFATEFAKFDPLQTITIGFGAPPTLAGSQAYAPTGFTLTRLRPDASTARQIRAMNGALSVHFYEYSSWGEAKAQAVEYLTRCLTTVDLLSDNPAGGIFLGYIDRFVFDGSPQEAIGGALFRPDSKFVAQRVLDRGYQWQSTCAWSEVLIGNTLTYQQLNVRSSLAQGSVGIVLDHSSVFQFERPCTTLNDLLNGQGNTPRFEACLDRLHTANTDLLNNLLNDEMLKRVGLKG